jgi:uncharacterized protein with PIN domain
MAAATPMFIADAALGRLATWLRLLGYDTVYLRRASIDELIRRAVDEGRILLTRNTRVIRRRRVPPYVFVESDDFRTQVRQVVEVCGLDAPPAFLVRCSRCNTPLEHLERATACASVPPYVCETQSSFARCPNCARVYWPATHVERMRRELEQMGLRVDEVTGDR